MENNYTFSHLRNPHNAIGADVKICKEADGPEEFIGKIGKITGVKRVSYPRFFEVTFAGGIIKNCIERDFTVVVNLEPNKRYMIMTGDIVTLYEYRPGSKFYFKYSELCNDPNNDSVETIERNGFAYHYDCGCNILKAVK